MTLKTLAAAACVSVFAATAGSATTTTVTVGGEDFNIEIITGTFLENEDTLIQNIFFGNDELAAEFALAFTPPPPFTSGPNFAFDLITTGQGNLFVNAATVFNRDFGLGGNFLEAMLSGFSPTLSTQFAIATPVSAVPLPAGGLLLLSGLGGVAALKRRKKRAA